MNSKPHLPPFLISKWGDTSYLQVTMGVFVRARRRHRAALLPWQQASTQEGPRGGWSSLVRLALPEREKRRRYRRRQLQSWPRGVRCLRESWLGRLAGLFIKTGASDKKSRHGGAERREVDLHVLSVNAGYSVYREVGHRDLEFRDTSK